MKKILKKIFTRNKIDTSSVEDVRLVKFDIQGLKTTEIELLCKSREVFRLLEKMNRRIEEKRNETIALNPANPDVNNIQEKLDRTKEITLNNVFYTLGQLPGLAEQVRKARSLDKEV